MSYTLRIIDQSKTGTELRRNIFIGEDYSVMMRTPAEKPAKEFERVLNKYYGEELPRNPIEVESIVGFIYANNTTYPIHDYNVVYIVNKEGQTFERVYGMYNKY